MPPPTATASAPSPTPSQPPPATPAPPLQPYDGLQPIGGTATAEDRILNVPFRSQYDSSPYQLANCGPAALAMVLQAYGLDVSNERLRGIANQLQGTTGYTDGIALDYLVDIAQQAGLRTEGLKDPSGRYHQWTMGDLIREIRRGYPVITLVHFASLPEHATSGSTSDHYVVVVGVTDAGFVINDPASVHDEGYHQLLHPEQLIKAWHDASIPQQAVAFLPPNGQLGLLPGPTSTAVPVAPPTRGPVPLPPSGLLQASVVVPTPSVPSGELSPGPTPASGRGTRPPPPPDATSVAWTLTLREWKHPVLAATIQAAPPTTTGPAASTVVLAAREANGDSPLALLVVVGVVAVGAIAILKAPRENDQADRGELRLARGQSGATVGHLAPPPRPRRRINASAPDDRERGGRLDGTGCAS